MRPGEQITSDNTRDPLVRSFDFWLVVAAIFITALAAWHYGWLNDDAYNYLTLATHISEGLGSTLRPEWGDTYWAVFPVGYPLLIAAFKYITGDAYTASKLLNALLMLGTIVLYTRLLNLPILAVSAVFLSFWGLEVMSYSWSENPFFFAHALAVASVALYFQTGKKPLLIGFFAGLVLALSSRYIGGFLLTGYGFAIMCCYGRVGLSRLIAALAVLTLAVGVFAGYLAYNIHITGHPSGMGRDPAPETLAFLLTQFAGRAFQGLWLLIPAALLLWAGRAKGGQMRWSIANPTVRLLLALGFAYLAILLALRLHSRFEQFTGRMLSPGLVLICLAVLKLAHDTWGRGLHAVRVRLLWLALFVLNAGMLYRDLIANPTLATTESYSVGMVRYEERYSKLPDGTAIIAAGYHSPHISWSFVSPVLGASRVFYVLYANIPLELKEYRGFLSRLRYQGKEPPLFVFDFTEFDTIQAFDAMIEKRSVDPALAKWMRGYFKPNSLVPCKECKAK